MIRVLALLCAVLFAGHAHAYNFVRGASGGFVAPTWGTDQTQQMPYACSSFVWINPSPSPSGAAGGGAHYPTGTGTQAKPFLTFSDMATGSANTVIGPGTCVNLIASVPMVDDNVTFTNLNASHNGGNTYSPTGFAVLRSTDGSGNLVPAAGVGITTATYNASAATIQFTASSSTGITLTYLTDYWLFDGLNIEGTGAFTTQNFQACVTIGTEPLLFNSPVGPSHFFIRNSAIHGCGGAGMNTLGTNWVSAQNNVVFHNAGAPGFEESGFSIAASQSGCTTYALNCAEPSSGFDGSICTLLNGGCIPYHQVISGNWFEGNYTFGQPPERTDGNGVIIDTNAIRASDGPSNSGPYPDRALLVNNVTVHNGGVGVHTFFSQFSDELNNTAIANYFDPGDNSSSRPNIDCIDATDCHGINNIGYAVGANTTVRVAYTLGSVGPVSVDDVHAMILTNSGVPPNGSNPMPVLMLDASQNYITAVTVDTTNVSTTPGGLSGTLTFQAVVNTSNGGVSATITPNLVFQSNSSPMINSYGGADFGAGTSNACLRWVQQTPPCTLSNLQAITLNGTLDTWLYNDWFGLNGGLGAAFISSVANPPPTLATAPGNNLQASDPTFTTPGFTVSPNFIMATLPTKSASGSGYSAGCKITLAGGSPVTAATVEVDSVSGSAINAYHLFTNGQYPGTGTTVFTQGSSTCGGTGATFSGATFQQPFFLNSAPPTLTLQGGSPAKHGGSPNWCPSQDFAGTLRACPPSMGAFE